MKKITFVLFSMVLSVPLWAEQPNWVSCKDKRNTLELEYTTTSYHGKPTFTYSRSSHGHPLLSRKVEAYGESIEIADSVLGEIISVVDDNLSAPDRSTEWVSLVLPHINLISKDPRNPDAKDPEVKFQTVVVETTSKTSFGGTFIVPGVVEDSRYFDVTCTAAIAVFAKPGNH
ncbi:MAG: hypothetical protein AAB309_04840 [Deltaproteobacteria bacterium]